MNYNAFLKNSEGSDVVGFNIPFGWCIDSTEDTYASIKKGPYGRYISISYVESSTDTPVFQDLPDSYLSVNDDGTYDEYYDSYEIAQIGETNCPYGNAYKYKATITTTEETDSPYGKIKIYDQMKHFKTPDDFEGDSRVEIGLFKWNGELFEIYYYDSNREAEEGYEGALKELIPKLF